MREIDYVPFSPIQTPDGKPVVEVTIGSPLEEARGDQGSQAGHKAQSSGFPTAVFETPNVFAYLRDLLPNQQRQGRMINLHTNDERSSGMSVTMSYEELGPGEPLPAAGGNEPPYGAGWTPSRDHAAWMRFGAGGSNHHVEFDCGEGNSINVPGSAVEVTLIDWTFNRNLGGIYSDPPLLTSYAHASSGSMPGHALFTTRVLTFYQVDLDLLNPPTLEQHMADLLEALSKRTLLD